MGQQQLILLVLATVIVGIAIVVGIRAFTENSVKANSDAMLQDLIRMANDAQAWKQKPAPFGGQTGAAKTDLDNFTGISWDGLGYDSTAAGIYENLNGGYAFTEAATSLTLFGCNPIQQNSVQIVVTGVTDGDITRGDVSLGSNANCALTSANAVKQTP